MSVRELELDLDAFEGPFDLLLTLVLREELPLVEVDVAGIVLAFVERLAEREELDLDACGEFLVLVAALLELKARGLFAGESDIEDLEPEEAAEELARRLEEYRRIKGAAEWLAERLAGERDRFFRLGPAPLAPRGERRLAQQDPEALAAALRLLAAEPPEVSLAHLELRFPPVSRFLEQFRAVLGRRQRFDFDHEVAGLSRVEQAVAFLALLELRRAGEISLEQAAPFAPIRVARAARVGGGGGSVERPLRLIAANPVDSLARTLEALLVVASQPLGVAELAEAAGDEVERVETALGLLGERYREGRSGIVLEQVAGGWAFRASREAAEALRSALRAAGGAESLPGCARDARGRRLPGPVLAPGDRALAGRRGRLGRRRARRAGPDRGGGAWRRRSRALPGHAALRAGVRPREPGRPAAARGSRRRRGRAPRPPGSARRTPPGLA